MEISAQVVKELREQTGAGVMDCKKALQESNGNFEAAKELLQKKSKAIAMKKASRVASEGAVHAYIHGNGKLGVLVEVNCETDFAAKNEDFRTFVKDLAMQVAALNPQYLNRDEVPPEVLTKQKEIFASQVQETGKPEAIIPKIVEGKIAKWYTEACLLDQPFVKDDKKNISALLTALIGKIGENITIRRFVRWQLGEGIEKRKDDFAAEVAAQAGLK
jgi:elongation factor Ts